ncbi:MAG TPA: ester cyclase [Bryobacteraceae bacterium]|nr:ester cyclase [Bryobacteraceae bacterium]
MTARMRTLEDHIRFESAHELEPLMATFGAEPEWHNQAGQEVLQGYEAIRGFYHDLFAGFPDFRIDVRHKHAAEEAVILEGFLGGTHAGEWMGIPATGKSFSIPFAAVFNFTNDNRVRKEIVYYDRMAILEKLGIIPGE